MRMRKVCGVICGAIVVVSAAAIALLVMYAGGIYLPGQTVNGKDVSWGKSIDVIYDELSSQVTPLELTANGETYVVSSMYEYDYDGDAAKQSFIQWLHREPIAVHITYTVRKEALSNALKKIWKPHADAYIARVDDRWEIVPELVGYDFDIGTALASISGNSLDLDALCAIPKVTQEDLSEDYKKVKWLNDFKLEYTNGVSLTGADLSEFVNDKFDMELPEDYVANLVKKLDTYTTTEGTVSVLHPVSGESITVQRKTYGKSLAVKDECAYVENLLQEHKSETGRVPELHGYDNVGDTYVLVSIDEQHLWYIKDGALRSETDVVTGRKGVHDTPKGAYYISECIPGKYLVGDTYRTWVNKWMRLTNSGIGLHDAGWRSRFGGDIFTYDGSHGCINLPAGYASEFYKDAYVGMLVIIY